MSINTFGNTFGSSSASGSLDAKDGCKAATTANITLSGEQTIDSISCVAGDRVLVKNQSTGSQNGIYLVATGSWSRASDLSAGASAAGVFMVIEQGTVSADVGYLCTNNKGSDVVGTDALVFARTFGDMYGPSSATDTAVAVYNGTTGKILKNSVVLVSTGGDVSGVAALTTTGARTVGVNPIVTAAGTTAGAATDHVVVFTGSTTHTYTLPACSTGRELRLKNRSTGAITVNRAGSDTIDNAGTTWNLAADDAVIFIGNGNNWMVF